jgi:hypothetical protein
MIKKVAVTGDNSGALTANLVAALGKLNTIVTADIQNKGSPDIKALEQAHNQALQIKAYKKAMRKQANRMKIQDLQNSAFTKGKK